MNKLQCLALAGALVASVVLPAISASATEPSLEPLYAVALSDDGLAFRVRTGGCTRAEDFRAGTRHLDGVTLVSLMRTKPDTCKGFFPEGIELFLSDVALGLQRSAPIVIENPLIEAHASQQ